MASPRRRPSGAVARFRARPPAPRARSLDRHGGGAGGRPQRPGFHGDVGGDGPWRAVGSRPTSSSSAPAPPGQSLHACTVRRASTSCARSRVGRGIIRSFMPTGNGRAPGDVRPFPLCSLSPASARQGTAARRRVSLRQPAERSQRSWRPSMSISSVTRPTRCGSTGSTMRSPKRRRMPNAWARSIFV